MDDFMKRIRWIWIILALYVLPLEAGINQKLLILSADGCRPDALLQAGAVNLLALADSGLYTWWALSRPPTKSGPCMLVLDLHRRLERQARRHGQHLCQLQVRPVPPVIHPAEERLSFFLCRMVCLLAQSRN